MAAAISPTNTNPYPEPLPSGKFRSTLKFDQKKKHVDIIRKNCLTDAERYDMQQLSNQDYINYINAMLHKDCSTNTISSEKDIDEILLGWTNHTEEIIESRINNLKKTTMLDNGLHNVVHDAHNITRNKILSTMVGTKQKQPFTIAEEIQTIVNARTNADAKTDNLKKTNLYKVARHKIERAEMKERFQEYIHIVELVGILIFVISAMLYRYTDYMKNNKKKFQIELAIYFASAVAVYLFMISWRGQWFNQKWHNVIFMCLVLGMLTDLIIVILELGGYNNMFVTVLDSRASVVTSNPSLGCNSTFINTPLHDYLDVKVGETMVQSPPATTAAPSPPLETTISLSPVSEMFTMDMRTSLTPTDAAMTSQPSAITAAAVLLDEYQMRVVQYKNNSILTMVVSSALTLVIILVGLLLMITYYAIFHIHSGTIVSYFADKPFSFLRRIGLYLAIVVAFLFEAGMVGFLTAIPMWYTVQQRNVAADGSAKFSVTQDKEFVLGEFLLVILKIMFFYILLQLCGAFGWAQDGYCRTRDQFNRMINDTTNDSIEELKRFNMMMNLIEKDIKIELFAEKLDEKENHEFEAKKRGWFMNMILTVVRGIFFLLNVIFQMILLVLYLIIFVVCLPFELFGIVLNLKGIGNKDTINSFGIPGWIGIRYDIFGNSTKVDSIYNKQKSKIGQRQANASLESKSTQHSQTTTKMIHNPLTRVHH